MSFPPEATGRIGDFVSFDKGKAPKETFESPGVGRLPYLSPEYLRGDAPPLYVVPTARDVVVAENDPIVLWDGSNAGEVFFAKPGVLASTMARVLPKNDEVQRIYLGHALKFHEGYLKALTAGSGIPHADKAIVKRLPFWKAGESDQNSVSAAISLGESAILAARSSIAKAERLQKGLMQQLLTGRLKPDGTLRRKSEFWIHPKAGLVPKGWEVSTLKRLAEIQRGKFSHRPRGEPRFYGGPYPFIQTGDVSNSRGYIISHNQTLSEEGTRISRRFPKGTIFISIVGVNVAATAIASYDVFATDSVIGMIPNDVVVSEYLEFYLRSVQQKLALLAGDSARENLNYGILKPLLVKYPSDPKEQQRIAEVLCNCESLIRAKEQKIAALQRLKTSLMQNLLTGRIRLAVNGAAKEAKP